MSSTLTARKANISGLEVARRFRTDAIDFVMRLQRENGDFTHVQALPGMKSYIVMSPELAHEVLVENADDYVKPEFGKRMMRDSFGNGIFFSEGDFWKRQRKLAQPAFHHARIRQYGEAMVAHIRDLLATWKGKSTVDVDKEMHALTLSIVVNALFKAEVAADTERIGEGMKLLGNALGEQTRSFAHFLLPSWVPTWVNRDKKIGVGLVNETVWRLIRERKASGEDKGDLLSVFLQTVDDETGEHMSDQQLRDELMTMFIAGHETSANALALAFLELARHPEIEAKLHAEVDSVLGGRLPTLDDLPRLTYTTQVIKETLRLYPIAFFVTRQAKTNGMRVGSSVITKRDLVMILPYVIHHDGRYYDAPEEFRPERFTADFEKNLPKCAYMPFGSGPRICIGNGFAMMEMQLILAAIISRYRLDLAPNQARIAPTVNLTLGFNTPVTLQLTERQPAKVSGVLQEG